MPRNNRWSTSPLHCPVAVIKTVVIPQELQSEFKMGYALRASRTDRAYVRKDCHCAASSTFSAVRFRLLEGMLHSPSLVHRTLDAIDRLLSSLLNRPCRLVMLNSSLSGWSFLLTPCRSYNEDHGDHEKLRKVLVHRVSLQPDDLKSPLRRFTCA